MKTASDVHKIISAYGHPISTRVVIEELAPMMESTSEQCLEAITLALSCEGCWRIHIGEDNGLIGLDTHEKPGDGSEDAAAEYLGLVELKGYGAFVPASCLNSQTKG